METLEQHFLDRYGQDLLTATYMEKNYTVINASRPNETPDSLYASLDLDLLQQYLDYVRAEAERNGISNVKVSLCFAQYPETEFDPRVDPMYKGYQTVFLRADSGSFSGGPNDLQPIEGVYALDFFHLSPPY